MRRMGGWEGCDTQMLHPVIFFIYVYYSSVHPEMITLVCLLGMVKNRDLQIKWDKVQQIGAVYFF